MPVTQLPTIYTGTLQNSNLHSIPLQISTKST